MDAQSKSVPIPSVPRRRHLGPRGASVRSYSTKRKANAPLFMSNEKRFVTEEMMVAQMMRLEITPSANQRHSLTASDSSDSDSNWNSKPLSGSLPNYEMSDNGAASWALGRRGRDYPLRPLEEGDLPRLFLSEEVNQIDPPELLPSPILKSIERPETALVPFIPVGVPLEHLLKPPEKSNRKNIESMETA